MPLPAPLPRGPRRAGWLVGLPALALIWAGSALYAGPRIAAALEAEGATVAATTATGTGEPWLRVSASGRDLYAQGEAPDVGERESVMARLAALEGPRRIVSAVGLVETAAPFLWAALRTGPGSVALEGSRPVEVGRRALEARVAEALEPGTALHDDLHAARGAPARFLHAAAFLSARLAELVQGARVSLADTVLHLAGEARDLPAYDALRAALARPPEGFSVGRVEVLPPVVAGYGFSVEKSAAGVMLRGFAPSEAAGEAVRAAAREAAEGAPVDDGLRIARGLDPRIDPDALTAFAFRLAGLIQSGRVALREGAVTVDGEAIDAQAIPEARALMRDERPAGVGAGPVTLRETPLSPYRVAIRRTAGGVTLTGHLPDAGTRERVLAILRPRLFREGLSDRTRLADGAPPELAAALGAAVPLLVTLSAGEVAVTDRALRLTGESLYREAAARAPERLAAALPPGWSGSARIVPRDAPERRAPDACRRDFAAAVAGADLRFPAGSAALAPGFYPTLDALAALARACPGLRIAVSGPADPGRPRAEPRPATEAQASAEPAAATASAPEARTPAGAALTAPAAPGATQAEPGRPESGAAEARPALMPAREAGRRPEPAEAAGKAEVGRSDASRSDAGKAVSAKAGAGKSGAGKSEPARPAAGPGEAGKPGAGRSPSATSEAKKAEARKPEVRKPEPGRPEPRPARAEAPEEPPADLPRQRALALVEYLLQAGARPEQVAPGPDTSGRAAFALLP